jgi:hypothetical protein
LIITPGCDLANQKVETVTYLPVIPVSAYLCSPGFFPELQRHFRTVLSQIDADGVLNEDRFSGPSARDLDAFEELIRSMESKRRSKKEKDLILRALAGVDALRNTISTGVSNVIATRTLLGEKVFAGILQRIVKNSYRTDIHFLPSDEQHEDWTAVAEPSVVLFRYALSAPLIIFDAAQDTAIKDWTASLENIATQWPVAAAFRAHRPVKCLTLKPDFLGDLLTRYVGMYVRLGSPDFSDETVSEYVRVIGEN